MASEIAGLEPLHGFIKQENKVVPVHFQFARKHGRQPEFIERKLPVVPRPSAPTTTTPVPAKQPETSAAAQTILPFSDLPADETIDKPKEAFVWDETKAIE